MTQSFRVLLAAGLVAISVAFGIGTANRNSHLYPKILIMNESIKGYFVGTEIGVVQVDPAIYSRHHIGDRIQIHVSWFPHEIDCDETVSAQD